MRFQVIEFSFEEQRERFSVVMVLRGNGLEYGKDVADALETIAGQIRRGAVRGTVFANDARPTGRWGFGRLGVRQIMDTP